ncbi:integrase core domain-containing protein [Streptomyces sp. NPDC057433]|uniref:integrase core domain-containing protein n=1 Tax=Streptomyces sp. NPDC057433 TaxID=3346132 RepID=UPI0036C65889
MNTDEQHRSGHVVIGVDTHKHVHVAAVMDTINALMESTIGLFKTELIKPRRPWKTLSDVELATAEYVDWYNHRRLHGEIGHVPPVEYENNHYLATTKPQVTPNV